MNKKTNINLNNKNILITGGTGSFGQAFTRHLVKNFKPKKIIIFSRDEFKQYLMSQEFNESFMRYFIGDVRDYTRMEQALNGVDFVIHAAAMKQVEASEYNPTECIRTNIQGAENVIRASIHNKVKRIIALSTDKAASPINLYGASKLVSDKLFIAANNIVGSYQTRFSIVRYGNVIGSRGSVIPLYKELLKKGIKKLPVTDKDMTRFVISLEEGVKFVCDSIKRMLGGEIFVPKLPSIKITELAQAMSGSKGLELIGLRPGEKIHELMIPSDSSHLTREYKDYYVIEPDSYFENSRNLSKNKGKPCKKNFEYSSATNPNFLSKEEILKQRKKFQF